MCLWDISYFWSEIVCLLLYYSILDRLWRGSTSWIWFCNHLHGFSAFPCIFLRDHLFFYSGLSVTGLSSVLAGEVQDGRVRLSHREGLWVFAVPRPTCGAVGVQGESSELLVSNTVTHHMPASSDLLGCRLLLIQTRSSFAPYIRLHNKFRASEMLPSVRT